MTAQSWKVGMWLGLWVAIAGLYACYFSIKADVAAMRAEVAAVHAGTMTKAQFRAWRDELESGNDRWSIPSVSVIEGAKQDGEAR